MNEEIKTPDVTDEQLADAKIATAAAAQPAETERLEREKARHEREAEAAVINEIVEKSNTAIDRLNALSAERIEARHAYGRISIIFELERTPKKANDLHDANDRLLAIDREHFALSRELALLDAKYAELSKTYDDKWTPKWSGLLGATADLSMSISSLIGSYMRTSGEKKTP